MANILIVDDVSFVRTVQKDILEKAGHKVIASASDGEEAIKLYEEYKPDLVIMDISMPKMNGLEAMKRILDKDPNAKVVICSAIGQEQVILRAIQAGAKDFIIKPFKPDRFLSAIEKALESS